VIPLVLLAGFLGAGKTRFLTTVIPALHAQGLRVRVVLNDFENANIDAARLEELTALVTPLAGECVCCTSLGELLAALEAVPREPNTVMLIEANGATEAADLLASLTLDRRLAQYTLPLQLTVIDAKRWQKRWWHNRLEASQVRTATHVHMNWTHRVSADRQRTVVDTVRALNSRASFTDAGGFATAMRRLASETRDEPRRPALLPALAADANGGSAAGAHGHAHAHTHIHPSHPFASAVLPLPHLVQRAHFLDFVRELPVSVVRAKGFVRFTDRPADMFVWNHVDGRKNVTLDESRPHANAQPVALFIGVDLPLAMLAERIAALE
jgi:G3E family GTPase